jgi:hypothetical protein
VRQHRSAGAPHTEQIHVERSLDVLCGCSAERLDEHHPRVGNRDVDPAEALDRPVNGPPECGVIGHVGFEPRDAVAQLTRELLEQLGLEANQGQVGASCAQPARRREANPSGGTGDEYGASADVVLSARRSSIIMASARPARPS